MLGSGKKRASARRPHATRLPAQVTWAAMPRGGALLRGTPSSGCKHRDGGGARAALGGGTRRVGEDPLPRYEVPPRSVKPRLYARSPALAALGRAVAAAGRGCRFLPGGAEAGVRPRRVARGVRPPPAACTAPLSPRTSAASWQVRRTEGGQEGGRASRGAGDGGRAVTGRCGPGQPPALGSARSALLGRLPPSSGTPPPRALMPCSRSGAGGPAAASFRACWRRREWVRCPSLSPVGRRASARSKSPAVPCWRPAASWGAELLVGVPELRAGLAAWPRGYDVAERREERRGTRRPGSALGGASKASEFPSERENLSFENFSFWYGNLRSSVKAVQVSCASEKLVFGRSARLATRPGTPWNLVQLLAFGHSSVLKRIGGKSWC